MKDILIRSTLSGYGNMVVKDLIDNDKGGWNLDLLNNILHHEDVEEVLRVSVLTNGDEDALVW